MSRGQIYEKLEQKLTTPDLSEADVVYILSRVRKILEIDKHKKVYPVLNFYCNFALHADIEDVPKSVFDAFVKIKDGTDYKNSIIGFEDFHKEFMKFLSDKGLPSELYADDTRIKNLRLLLLAIYSDTPVYLKLEDDYEVKLDANGVISFNKAVE